MDFLEGVSSSIWWASAVVTGALLLIFLFWKFREHDLLWADFWVRFWKLRRWKRQTVGIQWRETWEAEGMPPPERELYSYYKKHVPDVSLDVFRNAREYLEVSHQIGRHPTALWTWVVLFILTVAEAAGTGALIAPWVASELTGNQMVWIGYVIALVMATVLLFLTHSSGVAVYKFTSIRKNIGPYGSTGDGYLKEPISSGNDNFKDKQEDKKVRFANRVLDGDHDRGSIILPIVAAVFLVALLAGITWIRVKGIELQIDKEVTTPAADTGNPFANLPPIPGLVPNTQLPASVTTDTDSTRQKVQAEISSNRMSEGYGGAIVLSLIYLITQMVGFIQAYNHSFLKDGRQAYKTTRGEPRYETFESRYVTPVLRRADMRLNELRAHLRRRVEQYGRNPATLTCRELYYRELSQKPGDYLDHGAAVSTAPFDAPLRILPPKSPMSSGGGSLQEIALKIMAEPDAAERRRLLQVEAAGSEDREDQILQAIKDLKEQQESRSRRRNQILDEL